MASLHKCGKIWKTKDRANILRHLESCHLASKCLFRSRSPRSKNVIGVAQMVAFDLIYAAVKQQKKTKKILTIKLNLSSNLVIEFHVGGARFEITTAVLLFVVKNDINALFFMETGKKPKNSFKIRVRVIRGYMRKYGIQSIF